MSKKEGLATAHQWLASVSRELGINEESVRALTGDLLDMTAGVAHGPSRPAAPLTAFLVGVAAGNAKDLGDAEELTASAKARIAVVTDLLEKYQADQSSADE